MGVAMKIHAPISAIICSMAVMYPLTSFASCSFGYPSVAEEYKRSHYIVEGVVTKQLKNQHRTYGKGKNRYLADGVTSFITPTRIYKGSPPARILFFDESASSRFPLDVGKKYLLFFGLDAKEKGRMYVDPCGNSEEFALVKSEVRNYVLNSRRNLRRRER